MKYVENNMTLLLNRRDGLLLTYINGFLCYGETLFTYDFVLYDLRNLNNSHRLSNDMSILDRAITYVVVG
jgi:hypothetical protein